LKRKSLVEYGPDGHRDNVQKPAEFAGNRRPLTFNHGVEGSSPSALTIEIKYLAGFRDWLASGADPGRVYSEFLTKRSSGADETIFLALRSPPEMNTGYQPTLANRGTGHVGIHHQRALSAGLQAIFERHANAASSLGLENNGQSCKHSDLHIWGLHAVRPRCRIFGRTDLTRPADRPRRFKSPDGAHPL
jgi:hypothetical protein